MITLLVLALITSVPPDAGAMLGPPRGSTVTGETLERRTKEVASLLRCPVCQGLSVADSPAPMALNMKRQVRELLSQGYTRDQVLAYFERSYGSFVRLEPPRRGINWLVWLGPAAALLLGAILIASVMKRRGTAATPAVDADLDIYLARVRELAYGSGEKSSPDQSV